MKGVYLTNIMFAIRYIVFVILKIIGKEEQRVGNKEQVAGLLGDRVGGGGGWDR
jgi:hypothetical protein